MAEHEFEILDERFRYLVSMAARVEQIYHGSVWAEGPAYFPLHRSVIWSDIPNNRLLRWDELSEQTFVYEHDSKFTNGNICDRNGRLVSSRQGAKDVVRREHDGSITVLADKFEGKRFNSPNDVVEKSDGSIWFTDPGYGIDSYFEGTKLESEIGGHHVYRVDPLSGDVTKVADDFRRPNGLAFSPDEKSLYIVDSGGIRYPDNRKHIRRFDVHENGTLSGGEVFAECTNGKFDGFRFDDEGRIWTSASDGVHVYADDGDLIGKVLVPEGVSNLTFGGPRRNRLFITATSSLYAVHVAARGHKLT